MLAGELPLVANLLLVGITIWNKVDLSHVEESLGGKSLSEGASNGHLAAWALGLVVQVNLDLVGGKGGSEESSSKLHIL